MEPVPATPFGPVVTESAPSYPEGAAAPITPSFSTQPAPMPPKNRLLLWLVLVIPLLIGLGYGAYLLGFLNVFKPSTVVEASICAQEVTFFELKSAQTSPDKVCSLTLISKLLVEIPDVTQFKNLKELILSNNDIAQIPKTLGQAKSLERLILDENRLTDLPGSVLVKLPELVTLRARSNKLTNLPDEVGLLKKLSKIDISANLLSKLPDNLGEATNLKVLYADGNLLRELPKGIGDLKKLEYLSLSGNALTKLPDEIKNLTALKHLHLENNQFSQEEKERIKKLLPQVDIVL
jgi:Leucine-rich repeat (LRR) protein